MAYTSHGHHIPGTLADGEMRSVARCGGLSLCAVCQREARQWREEHSDFTPPPGRVTTLPSVPSGIVGAGGGGAGGAPIHEVVAIFGEGGGGGHIPTPIRSSKFGRDLPRPKKEFATFVRKPFTVEAIQITRENIDEVAHLVGVVRVGANGRKFIQVDKTIVPNVPRAFPGFWITRMGDNVRCYSHRIFTRQFVKTNGKVNEAVRVLTGEHPTLFPEH